MSCLPPSNVSVSNVPGPSGALHSGGNVVSDLYSVGPLIDGIGMNITVWSYGSKTNFSIMSCKKALPDIHLIAHGMETALAELLTAK